MGVFSPYKALIKNALRALVLVVFFCFSAILLQSHKQELSSAEKINSALNDFINDPELAHASISFYMADGGNGKAAAHNANQSLIPASVQKIITTGAALGILGEDHTFKTQLAYSGTLQNGLLNGNLYIIGGGDPTLGYDRVAGSASMKTVLNQWVEAVKKAGINKINGAVIADASRYETAMQPPNWAWNDISNYYGAGASGLSFHENYYSVAFSAGKQGSLAQLNENSFYPPISGMHIKIELYAGAPNSGDNAYIFGAPYNFDHVVRGTIPAGSKNFKIKGAVPDPPLMCAQLLANNLEKEGINIIQIAKTSRITGSPDVKNLEVIHTITSPRLKEIVYNTNLNSLNLYAEHLLKECGFKVLNEGSTEVGIKAVTQFWRARDVDTKALFMQDGSGLSHYNGISAKQLVQILKALQNESYFDVFYKSLPVAGESGSMRNMGDKDIIDGRMRAKTGHMERIRSYAGYVKNSSGRLVPFALIVNNYTCSSAAIRAKIERLLIALG